VRDPKLRTGALKPVLDALIAQLLS
jgi:hypothetical protein